MRAARNTERRAARGDLDPVVAPGRALDARLIARRLALLRERQAMPHVEQRLLVHRLVLENREHGLGAVQQRMARLIDVAVEQRVDHLAIGLIRKRMDFVARRPSIATISPSTCPALPSTATRPLPPPGALVRIDPAREEILQPRIDARAAEPLLDQRVEAEAGQVAFVEHDRMAQRDRAAVVGLFVEQIEERARPLRDCAGTTPRRPIGRRHPCIFIRNRLK